MQLSSWLADTTILRILMKKVAEFSFNAGGY